MLPRSLLPTLPSVRRAKLKRGGGSVMRQLRREGVALAYEDAGSGAPPIMLIDEFLSQLAERVPP